MEAKDTSRKSIFTTYTWFYILGVVILLLSISWLYNAPDWEPSTAVAGSIASLIAIYWNDEGRKTRSNENRSRRVEIISNALARIQRERDNFEKLQHPVTYSGELHRKAVEVYSFELLEKELANLKGSSTFNRGEFGMCP